MRVLILAATAALLTAQPSATLQAQGLFPETTAIGGVTLRQYDYEDGFGVDYVRQLAFPIGVVLPLGQRFSVDIGTYYATTFVGIGGSHESFQDLTDTQVRGTYVFGNDAVVASVMLNLPTGPETTTLQSFGVAASSASNFLLFPVNTYGSGFSLTPGLAGAVTAGDWNLGLAASVRWSAEYQPFSGSANSNVKYQPGVETRIRAGVDRLIGQGRLALGATYSTFANDELTGSGAGGSTFDPGNRILVDGEFSTRAGAGTIALYAWNYHRSGSGSATGGKENVFTAGLSGSWGLGANARLEPLVEGRFWSPEDGNGKLVGIGSALRYQVTPSLTLVPSARVDVGSVETPTSNGTKSVLGWELSTLLRVGL